MFEGLSLEIYVPVNFYVNLIMYQLFNSLLAVIRTNLFEIILKLIRIFWGLRTLCDSQNHFSLNNYAKLL